ncbi:MAG TPA: EI24 domain-containing protein [Pseudolysinimonas sp.]|nr:EI24 domain-containing protein [Pseudolysinimonas sp.]
MTPPRAPAFVTEFFGGVGLLLRGFALWRRRPGLMALGLVPAVIVAAVLLATLIALVLNLDAISAFLTPFADGWPVEGRRLLRIFVALAILIGVIVIAAFGFTALTLLVGEPFYEKIWREVETELGGMPARVEPGFWRTVRDSVRLVGRAALTAAGMAGISLIPIVGAPVAAVLGLFLSGRLVALELTARALEARGMTALERRELLRSHSPRVLGFGVAVHLCFLVPGGAILVMPAAVAGATYLARHALDRRSPPTE